MQLITFNLQLIQVIFLYNLLINCVHSRFSIKPPFKFSGQSSKSNVTTENPFVGRDEPDVYWIDALRDIAYFLRRYKFIEYDRRYHKNSNNAPRQYFAHFPKPPLRTLHWEVHKYCEETFVACVEHLHSRIKKTDLRRSDDTGVVMLQQNWSFEKNKQQIDAVQTECEKLKKNSEILINPFEGPLERFQWSTTASYYMCWYTMHEVRDLQHLNESCDNFVSCLDANMKPRNYDVRAEDSSPFLCAMYSFCPDPCCPRQHLSDEKSCLESPDNPCFESNPSGQRECVVKRRENRDFRDIILNRWNVTCRCPRTGFVWDSRYGICVDVDECLTGIHECDPLREACVNLVGTYECACRWGFYLVNKKCTPSPVLSELKLNKNKKSGNDTKLAKSVIKQMFQYIFPHSSSNIVLPTNLYPLIPYLFFLIFP